jgi:hypothetical protein
MQSVESSVIGFIEVESPESVDLSVLSIESKHINSPPEGGRTSGRWSSQPGTVEPHCSQSADGRQDVPVIAFRFPPREPAGASVVAADLARLEKDLQAELEQLLCRIARLPGRSG